MTESRGQPRFVKRSPMVVWAKIKRRNFFCFGILIHLDSSKGEYEDVTCLFFGKTADHDRTVHKTLNS